MTEEQILLAVVASVAGLGVYGLYWLVARTGAERVKERLHETGPGLPPPLPVAQQAHSFSAVLNRVGQAAARPLEPKTEQDRSNMRRELGYAGIYSSSAAKMWLGAKVLLLAVGLVLGYLISVVAGFQSSLLAIAIGSLSGYLAPVLWLRIKTKAQQRSLEHALPDALDLMVVCVESGLTMDAAMQRVGREITLAHAPLARELAIAHMETQMGLARSDALRNMADRTGSPSIKSLSAMLIQADRFGTSIATALRVYSESLRIKRQHAAEEMAAKTAVKMTIPLVLCVFPAVLVVVGGPAVIRVLDALEQVQ